MLSHVDKKIALIGDKPWPDYIEEHGMYENPKPEEIIRKHFPDVEIVHTKLTINDDYFWRQFNTLSKGYDYVTRFDVDMLMKNNDWNHMINFVRSNEYNFYKLNFTTNSIDYYVDFDHGIMDANERDTMITKQDNYFHYMTETAIKHDGYTMEWPGWMVHHFRGWNKPKSTNYDSLKSNPYFKDREFISAPKEIREMFDDSYIPHV
jgi:hypothetical protein